jgi:hypothetical protein
VTEQEGKAVEFYTPEYYAEEAKRTKTVFDPETRIFTDPDGERYMLLEDASPEFKSAEAQDARREVKAALQAVADAIDSNQRNRIIRQRLEAVDGVVTQAIRRQLESTLFAAWARKEAAAGRDDFRFGVFIRAEGYLVSEDDGDGATLSFRTA